MKANQLENKINQPEKNCLDEDSLRENKKNSYKNNKLILTSQQRFTSEKYNAFTEEVNKIKEQSVDSIEVYAYGASKDVVCKKKIISVTISIETCVWNE